MINADFCGLRWLELANGRHGEKTTTLVEGKIARATAVVALDLVFSLGLRVPRDTETFLLTERRIMAYLYAPFGLRYRPGMHARLSACLPADQNQLRLRLTYAGAPRNSLLEVDGAKSKEAAGCVKEVMQHFKFDAEAFTGLIDAEPLDPNKPAPEYHPVMWLELSRH